jgi:hypothetical protein
MKKIFLPAGGIKVSAASFAQLSFGVQATGSLASAHVKSKYDIDFDKDMNVLPVVELYCSVTPVIMFL